MRMHQVVIYGSYGYTGSLIAEECKSQNLKVLLSGRDGDKLKQQSNRIGYPYQAADINDSSSLCALLERADVVIHCGGPFRYTAKQMAEACLITKTHYTDITGEYEVFELLAQYDALAKERGILIMPGTGFDVVPSDCLAVHLKNKLPEATHLQLAFAMSKGGLSRGTAKTMVEGMGYAGVVRQNGKIVSIPLGDKVMDVNFGAFKTKALCIPWGDVATAWRSTGIPNIEVYSGVPNSTIRLVMLTRWINPLLRKRWVKDYLLTKIDKRSPGPEEHKRNTGRSYLWGKVTDLHGHAVEARLETVSGYLLTAKASVLIAQKISDNDVRPGYFTPAQYFGSGLILQIPGSAYH